VVPDKVSQTGKVEVWKPITNKLNVDVIDGNHSITEFVLQLRGEIGFPVTRIAVDKDNSIWGFNHLLLFGILVCPEIVTLYPFSDCTFLRHDLGALLGMELETSSFAVSTIAVNRFRVGWAFPHRPAIAAQAGFGR
jgi:hypothetical protein